MNRPNETAAGVRIKPVALPAEHGGWALLFEPIILGLLLAPSLAGVCLSLSATAVFLARHPFKLAVCDLRQARQSRRTPIARRFALLYFTVATVTGAIAIKMGGTSFLTPILFAAPLVVVQLYYDSLGRSRAQIAELAGAIATGSLATAIAIAGGWPRQLAFVLWIIIAARNVPTILYLRARLKLLHRKPASPRWVVITHVLALVPVIAIVNLGLAPSLALVAFVILLLRAVVGFSNSSEGLSARRLGLREIAFGAMTVLTVTVGYKVGW